MPAKARPVPGNVPVGAEHPPCDSHASSKGNQLGSGSRQGSLLPYHLGAQVVCCRYNLPRLFILPSGKLTWPWKIHHFDGIYQERWGFSWAMLVYQRVLVIFFILLVSYSKFLESLLQLPTMTFGICREIDTTQNAI